jgi:hypothetical protein
LQIIQLVSLAEDERKRANKAEDELTQVRNQLERLKAQAEEEVFHGLLNKSVGSCFRPSLQSFILKLTP